VKKFAIAALALSAVACASPVGPYPIQSETAGQSGTAALIRADAADVRITEPQDAAIHLRVGQTIGVTPFLANAQWQVSFSNDALSLQTPIDKLAAPGNQGWVWKALAPGTTDITFTSTAPCSVRPCPSNVLRVTLTLDISASL
jgi:hypothetical protein